jgi:hypothetical protein
MEGTNVMPTGIVAVRRSNCCAAQTDNLPISLGRLTIDACGCLGESLA